MTYIIQNTDTGEYVARPGDDSYTKRLDMARPYQTRAQAEKQLCGNERVLSIEEAMRDAL